MKNNPIPKTKWIACEPLLFWGLVLINTIPVLVVNYFYTGDGPAHLYNANIIGSLITHTDSPFARFYQLRPELIPNMGGHTLLVSFKLLFGPWLAEKIVYLISLIVLPLSFRFVVRAFCNAVNPVVFVVFLLNHHFCFYIGFQSFSIGLGLMLFTVGVAHKVLHHPTVKNSLALSLLLFLTAYFHLFAAVAALLAVGVLAAVHFANSKFIGNKKVFFLPLATVPTLWFIFHFMWDKSAANSLDLPDLSAKVEALYSLVLVTLYVDQHLWMKLLVGALLAIATAFTIGMRIKRRAFFNTTDFAFYGAILFLALYFLLPDKMASGGFISIRLLLCALLFYALWFALNADNTKRSWLLGALFLMLSVARLPTLVRNAQALSADAREMLSVLPFLEDGQTLVPLNYSDHWLHYNMALLLGAEKQVVVMDNYEASTNHFPVMWRPHVYSTQSLGDVFTSNRPTLHITRYEEATGIPINAVVRWLHNAEMNDPATLHTDSVLNLHFRLVHTSATGKAKLYLRNKE